MRFVLVSGPVVLAFIGVVAACVGNDPMTSGAAPDASPGSVDAPVADSGADAAADASDASDAGAPVYGAFLTAMRYPSNFESGATDVRALVDQLCSAAAAAAGLTQPSAYHALIAVHSVADSALDANLLQPYTAASAGRWCAIAPMPAPHPNCDGSNEIFSKPSALVTGPEQSLISDERGLAPAQGSGGLFLSGLNLPAGATSGLDIQVQNCASWSVQADTGGPDGGPLSAGVGSVRHVTGPEVDYRWLGREATRPCDATLSLPLLCLQRPPGS